MRKEKVSKFIIYPMLLLFISVLIYSLYNIISWYIDGKNNEKIIEELNEVFENDEDIITDENTIFNIDFDRLKSKNNEVVAFVKVNGTNIEYSVVKHNNNSYYLNHSFDRSYNKYGWIFANYENKFDGSDKNITLFGHNMKNGSMFGSLKNVLTSDWQSNKDNLSILFVTPEGTYIYQVFSTYKVYKEEYFATSNFKDDKEFLKFIKTIKSRSNRDYGLEVTKDDQILTLSTCYKDNNYRVVLHAKIMYQSDL